jgi:two-component system sensor histidine kinase QseC
MRSLRSRLIVGMLVGLAALLIAADTAIYTVQRRQLNAAFDATLLASANALGLLVHPGPHGVWFDAVGLSRLTEAELRAGALFQLWSDEPIDVPGPRPEAPEFGPDGPPGPPEPELDEWWEPPPRGERGRGPGRSVPFGDPPPGRARTRVIRSEGLGEADLPQLEPTSDRPRFECVTLPDGRAGRAAGVRIHVAPPPGFLRAAPANVTAVVAAPSESVDQQLGFLRILLACTGLGTLAVALGVAWLVVTRGLRPLDRVAGGIAALDATGLKQRFGDHEVPREVRPLVAQLNAMLGRLDEAFERERALTADIAHELRTPVAEIRAIADVTLKRSRGVEEYRQALTETREVICTLQGLIEKLLVLARLEGEQVRPDLQPIPLAPFLREHWAQLEQRAADRRVTFDAQCPADLEVAADPLLIGVVLTNALGNAVAYVPDAGKITAVGRRTGAQVRLEITNTGCGLTPRDAARVFDRFWRADHARRGAGLNCGLGLTLVRRAMQVMAGTAEARVDEQGCFVLTLTFVEGTTAL